MLVKRTLLSKELNHKRLSKNGRQFLLFLAEFFAFINSVWALSRLDLLPQFCKNLRNAPGVKVLKY